MKRALVIYSGGLDTTVCIPLLREEGFDEISTVTIDVGQPAEDIKQAEERAAFLKAIHTTVDAKAEFADVYCTTAMAFNADYFGYPLSTAIARPLIAKKAAEVGLKDGPFDAIVHGCTGKGNDQFRIEYGLRIYAPGIPVYAPGREKNWTRTAEIEYAEKVGAPIGQSKHKIWSIDENLWGRSIEGGRLEEPNFEPPEEIFQWTKSLADAPNEPEYVAISFDKGVPISMVTGTQRPASSTKRLSSLDIILQANILSGKHGIGRIDIMEDRMIGMKVRENYECPGATLLIRAHKELEALVCAPRERRFKEFADKEWAELTYQGLWGDPLFEDLVAFSNNIQKRVTGTVTLKLFKGGINVVGRESEWALYSEAVASFDDASTFEQKDMGGMVRAHGLSSLLYAKLEKGL